MIYFVEHWRLPLKIRYFNFYKSTHEKIILDDFVDEHWRLLFFLQK